jgi:hypothetical protein
MGKIIDLSGKIFGNWKVLEYAGIGNNKYALWFCRCTCGHERIVDGRSLRNGLSKSCGCSKPMPHGRLPVGESSKRALFRYMKQNSKYRKVIWNLHIKFFEKITKQDCHYCGAEPQQIYHPKRHNGEYIYNGIDRVDNEVGYIPSNCVPCCGYCNWMKSAAPVDSFKEWIVQVYSHWASK